MPRQRAQVFGVVMAGGAFVAYIESRTLGLPGLPSWEPFTEPPGVVSVVVEAIFMGLAMYVLARRRRATTSSGEDVTQDPLQFIINL